MLLLKVPVAASSDATGHGPLPIIFRTHYAADNWTTVTFAMESPDGHCFISHQLRKLDGRDGNLGRVLLWEATGENGLLHIALARSHLPE